jgi:hypothetical protein
MRRFSLLSAAWVVALIFMFSSSSAIAGAPPTNQTQIEAALENIVALDRPGQQGLATVFDGNKYIQCRRMTDHALRCEAAGALLQPSLSHVLVPERVARLAALGWSLDPSFGNYAQTFPADAPVLQTAEKILKTLTEGYDADLSNLDVESDWIANQACPPRNGPSQNLAGMINDAPSMAKFAIHACAYTPEELPAIKSATDLANVYGTRMTGEIQCLRVNLNRDVFVIFQTEIGYIQCAPQTSPRGILCEAQSADSWAALASALTPERVARLHAAGYVDPGRVPNYWRNYPLQDFDDATIAHELMSVLYEVYGYAGSPKLEILTEKGHS